MVKSALRAAGSASPLRTGDGERDAGMAGRAVRKGEPGAPVAADADTEADSVDGDAERASAGDAGGSGALSPVRFEANRRENMVQKSNVKEANRDKSAESQTFPRRLN